MNWFHFELLYDTCLGLPQKREEKLVMEEAEVKDIGGLEKRIKKAKKNLKGATFDMESGIVPVSVMFTLWYTGIFVIFQCYKSKSFNGHWT